MHNALNSLAVVVPECLRKQVPAEWFDRYGKPLSQWRLPRKKAERHALAETIGQDGYALWQMMTQSVEWTWECEMPAVQTLRQVWLQQYYVDEDGVHQREKGSMPPAERKILSPYDTEARYSRKRSTEWCGYKVHLSETCEEDQPLLITRVETTPSTTQDVSVTETIRQHLEGKDLLPEQHVVDADMSVPVA
jgi:transposase